MIHARLSAPKKPRKCFTALRNKGQHKLVEICISFFCRIAVESNNSTSAPRSTCFVYKMSKGVRGLHDGLVKTGKFKEAKVIDEFNHNHISFNSFCAIFDRRLAESHATLCVDL